MASYLNVTCHQVIGSWLVRTFYTTMWNLNWDRDMPYWTLRRNNEQFIDVLITIVKKCLPLNWERERIWAYLSFFQHKKLWNSMQPKDWFQKVNSTPRFALKTPNYSRQNYLNWINNKPTWDQVFVLVEWEVKFLYNIPPLSLMEAISRSHKYENALHKMHDVY